jgi:hypothetical protein
MQQGMQITQPPVVNSGWVDLSVPQLPRRGFELVFGLTVAFIWATTAQGASKAPPIGLVALHVPPGFKVEKVAGAGLVNYPMMGTIDDRGRLFLCESSGNTLTTDQMAAKPDYVIRMLEDTNGDGVYDRSTSRGIISTTRIF